MGLFDSGKGKVIDEYPRKGYNTKRSLETNGKTLFYLGSALLALQSVVILGINIFSRDKPERRSNYNNRH